MKRIFLLFFLLVATISLSAQTVENIRVEQDGDKLEITYRIGGSTSDETYFVTLTCSIDGGTPFEPKSTLGDVGQNIAGGKPVNTIIWDVFKDVDEIGEVEFFVKVELEGKKEEPPSFAKPVETPQQTNQFKTDSKPSNVQNERHFFVAYSGTSVSPYGAKLGYIKNWGFYGAIRIGATYNYEPNYLWEEIDVTVEFAAGIAKQIVQYNKFRAYAYGGIGYGGNNYEFYDNVNTFNSASYIDYYGTFDFGAMGVLGMFYFDLGLTVNGYYGASPIFGIGLVF